MKELKIRELVWDDVYTAAEILKPIKVDLTGVDLDKDTSMVSGITIFKNMIANAKDSKTEIDNFLGSLFGISGEEFNKLPMLKAMKCMKQFKEIEGFGDFFGSVKSLMK